MRDLEGFEPLSRGIAAGFSRLPGAHGLVFVGSSAVPARRDRWSDHDFLALVDAEHAGAARDTLSAREASWLPDPSRIVLTAREGDVGFTVVYDDGHVLEFAVASTEELSAVAVDEAEIAFGDDRARRLVEDGQRRSATVSAQPEAANETGLVFVKLLIGYGRARRGERTAANRFIRGWAVDHLLRAVRARAVPIPGVRPDLLDPSRRLEASHPELAARLDVALEGPLEQAARAVAALTREALEPRWPDFPSAAADVVQAVLDESAPVA